jgi:hypothetical protein
VCLAPDPRTLLALDLAAGKQLWRHDLPGPTTLSGEAPQILADGTTLLLVTPTNLGYRLERLDRSTGQPCWPRPCLLPMQRLARFSPDGKLGWDLDGEAVYFARDGVLCARALADGRPLWERPLPGASWAVRRVRDGLVAYPDLAPTEQFQFLYLGASLQWVTERALTSRAGFPLVCLDPHTGELAQRLNFPGLPRVRLGTGRPGSLVVRGPFLAPAVRLDPRGGLVALAGDVWGLATDPP